MNRSSLPTPRTLAGIALSAALLSSALVSCGEEPSKQKAEEPTKEIVEKVMKATWDKKATSTNARSALTLNSVKFGQPYKATAQEVQVEGLPDGATVTPAIIDFTVRTYYTNETQVLRRVREARVYKDKFGEWAVMTGSVKGQDESTTEPAEK
jgi:hypothetical protein